jgi:hypothetical protein
VRRSLIRKVGFLIDGINGEPSLKPRKLAGSLALGAVMVENQWFVLRVGDCFFSFVTDRRVLRQSLARRGGEFLFSLSPWLCR